MRMDSELYLLKSGTTGKDVNGDPIITILRRRILGEKQSVRQSEFYQAAAAKLNPELVFVIWTIEYASETKLEYNGLTYSIIRTFNKNGKETELVCTSRFNGGGSSG
ncbi:phage head closure protein [Paenibacillus donghaensis]|uniref:Phage head-tail adapter protein n=1 Tax=Paenibacillus donghaensis TaxID=414771 RepID=A0A2Z2KRH3_9BACL|nr:phage head closure protein [Paenibacillus donghaensis]ASA25419.1 hypothetical protein B9T62_34620 [Paenibacillus donghaensis]